MREVHGRAYKLAFVAVFALGMFNTDAQSAETYINQNLSGFSLPGVQLPQGHDEVRAADGTTCRSAVSGSGAYLDIGLIGNPEQVNTSASFSAYTRMVIPLGKKPKRLDCSRLYDLEIQRLEMELKLMQMGLTRGIAPADEAVESAIDQNSQKPVQLAKNSTDSWEDDGWTTTGLNKK